MDTVLLWNLQTCACLQEYHRRLKWGSLCTLLSEALKVDYTTISSQGPHVPNILIKVLWLLFNGHRGNWEIMKQALPAWSNPPLVSQWGLKSSERKFCQEHCWWAGSHATSQWERRVVPNPKASEGPLRIREQWECVPPRVWGLVPAFCQEMPTGERL